jgi:redox-sensitive bicupin YhaK (pirin superfamily)
MAHDGRVSGPVSTDSAVTSDGPGSGLEVLEPREAQVGPMTVQRVLPRRQRRTVGAWCFVDLFGPALVDEAAGIDIGPHPHTGLHTVTYLLDGQVLHRDSLGSEQVITPGQVNLMTAGSGVVHAEEPTGHYRGALHGVQLWVAQPESTRHGGAAFEHHAELPQVDVGDAQATLLVGELANAVSPARQDTPLLGADLRLQPGSTTIPLRSTYEHLVVVLAGHVQVDGKPVATAAYLGLGREQVELTAPEQATVLLLGGEPLGEELLMWWNFVGRSRDELVQAARQWAADDVDRFGRVSTNLGRVAAPPTPWGTS